MEVKKNQVVQNIEVLPEENLSRLDLQCKLRNRFASIGGVLKCKTCKNDDSVKPKQLSDNSLNRRRRFSIVLSWLTIFTSLLQYSMFAAILPAFLAVLDPDATKNFAMWTVVSFSFGQLLTPPIFGFWSNKIKQCRLPICFGLVMLITGNIAFCCLEAFPVAGRKWAMMFIRIYVGLGAGVVSVPRNYCATASTKSERPKAVSGSTAGLGLSVIAGPGAQAIFSAVGYPGVYIGNFHLHMYNAPAFASIFIHIILLILNWTLLLERYPDIEEFNNQPRKSTDGCFNKRPLPKYDRIGALATIWTWFSVWIGVTNFVMLGVPYTQAQFDWSLTKAIMYNGYVFGAFAATSLSTYVIFAFFSNRWDDRKATIAGATLIVIFYLITLPWPGYPLPTVHPPAGANNFANNSELTNSSIICKYASSLWCYSTPRIPMALYMCAFPLLAIGFPAANSALSILLTKLLGPRRQGTMQGTLITGGGSARALGPLCMSVIFFKYGPQASWMFSTVMTFSGLLTSILFRNRMGPLVVEPKLKPGEFFRYKMGILYRF